MFDLFKKTKVINVEDIARAFVLGGLGVIHSRDVSDVPDALKRVNILITDKNEIKVIFTACEDLSMNISRLFEIKYIPGEQLFKPLREMPNIKVLLPASKIQQELRITSDCIGSLNEGWTDEVHQGIIDANERIMPHAMTTWTTLKMQETLKSTF